MGALKSTDCTCAVTTEHRAWRSATIAAASSIIASATPPNSVPIAFACPGITIFVTVTLGSSMGGLRERGAGGGGGEGGERRSGSARRGGRVEGTPKVRDEVVLVLDPAGDADEAVGD